LRDYSGYAETRRQLLVGKPSVQANWVTYAVALYLAKDFSRALEVLSSFEKTVKEEKTEKLKKKERSELTLFEARIYEAMGEPKKAIHFINKSKLIVNLVAKHEMLARLYNAVGNKDEAINELE
jgi:tetratricopeptide (TPR) repeat protein